MPVSAARALLLAGSALGDDAPPAHADADGVLALIERLGFVQIDSIHVVERAHHHILWTRSPAYRPAMLDELQRSGRVFEHWTHDASIIPSEWFPHWKRRFGRVTSWAWAAWLTKRLGRRKDALLAAILDRIRREGPLMARDFEAAPGRRRASGTWWDWKPAKAALEYWWRAGELAIPHRVNFQKVYDLTERVLPHHRARPAPPEPDHVAWACRTALDRIGAGTPREIAAFWRAVDIRESAAWCAAGAKGGEIVPVLVEDRAGARRAGFAVHDWRERAAAGGPGADGEIRLISPFDPLIRDRTRCGRLFGFDYRFEAFVPEKKRTFGYYVLPMLEGGCLVGRLDPRLDREAGALHVRRVWWEPGVKPTRRRRAALADALDRYAAFNGVARVVAAAPAR